MSKQALKTKPVIDIYYCTQCNWLLRSGWVAQELLNTFADDLSQVALHPDSGGRFQIYLDEQLIWDRKADNGFPDIAELKRRVRDLIDPSRDMGHTDKPGSHHH